MSEVLFGWLLKGKCFVSVLDIAILLAELFFVVLVGAMIVGFVGRGKK